MWFIEGLPAPKWIQGLPFFIPNFEFSWYKQLTGKVWKKICCKLYFDGISLQYVAWLADEELCYIPDNPAFPECNKRVEVEIY